MTKFRPARLRHAPTASPAGPAPMMATSVYSTICSVRYFGMIKKDSPRANAGADDACQVRADERAPADHAGANACAVRSPNLPVRGHADDVHHECEDANDPLAHERDCDGGALRSEERRVG